MFSHNLYLVILESVVSFIHADIRGIKNLCALSITDTSSLGFISSVSRADIGARARANSNKGAKKHSISYPG